MSPPKPSTRWPRPAQRYDKALQPPTGLLIGFASEEDWFEYRLEHHPEFLRRIQAARRAIQAGQGVRIEDVAR